MSEALTQGATPVQLNRAETPPASSNRRARIGSLMMAGSWLLWVLLPFVPVLPVSAAGQATTAGAILIASSAVFWSGAFIAGAGLARAGLGARVLGWVRGLFTRR